MENENLIKNIEELINNVSNIQKKLYEDRKANKGNFNFFDAIVSGKYEKHHIEKYHSNFIAYLLNPKGSHDFGSLFLEYFLKIISIDQPIQNLELYTLERERMTDNGRFIDISLEYNNNSIIFIENKISSEELEEQVSDYYSFADKKFDNVIAIYLTLNGERPTSTKDEKITCLSYKQIINWIELCVKDESVKQHLHIISALNQYLSILNKLLNNMNEETQKTTEYLLKNKDKSVEILKNISLLKDSIYHLVKKIRDEFLIEMNDALEISINENNIPINITIEILQGDYIYKDVVYGLGFMIKLNDEYFKYGGGGFGGLGEAIYINDISAHTEIDKTNAILLEAYETEEWNRIATDSANRIIAEVKEKVLPKIGQ